VSTQACKVQRSTISALGDLIGLPNVIKIDAEGAELDIVQGGWTRL
jgi:hypothetical protein